MNTAKEEKIHDDIENFSIQSRTVNRLINRRDGSVFHSKLKIFGDATLGTTPSAIFDQSWLRSGKLPDYWDTSQPSLLMADLFCGLGGMSLGVVEAGKALGINVVPKMALDFDKDSLSTYKLNFDSAACYQTDIATIIDGEIGDMLTESEKKLKSEIGNIDLVIGGPPCQGNSDLNNHTRRKDPKNQLLLKVVRFAEVFSPQNVIIENVQGVRHDKEKVTVQAIEHLNKLGYKTHEGLLMASHFGVAQNRRRYFLVATKVKDFDFEGITKNYGKEERTFDWACSDLYNEFSEKVFDTPAKHSKTNQDRIEYLFTHDLHELPDDQRPNCHKNGNHSYKSVYGRLHINKPAPTITSGFGSIGQGRFCHPIFKRSITPHEAARLQFMPDFFRFPETIKRASLQKMIGNAVPSKLSYLVTLELLR